MSNQIEVSVVYIQETEVTPWRVGTRIIQGEKDTIIMGGVIIEEVWDLKEGHHLGCYITNCE